MCRKVSDINVKSPTHLYAIVLIAGTWLATGGVAGALAIDYNGCRSHVSYIVDKLLQKPSENYYNGDYYGDV